MLNKKYSKIKLFYQIIIITLLRSRIDQTFAGILIVFQS